MKKDKAVYVTKNNKRDFPLDRTYQLYTDKVLRPRRYNANTSNVGVKYIQRRDNVVCTCRHISPIQQEEGVYSNGYTRQTYVYQGSKSNTNIGVGAVTAQYKKKVRRIHLGETNDKGVGSYDLSSYLTRKPVLDFGLYDNKKKMSTKCVGSVLDITCIGVSKEVSPMTLTFTENTSGQTLDSKTVAIGLDVNIKKITTAFTQTEKNSNSIDNGEDAVRLNRINVNIINDAINCNDKEMIIKDELKEKRLNKSHEIDKMFSSNSLIQQVHNLEDPCVDKTSVLFADIMKKKFESNYRKLFCVNSKTEVKKTVEDEKIDKCNNMMQRFEALRQGIAKKEETKRNNTLYIKDSSDLGTPSKRDVSIVSDPPSLEGRSYSNTKLHTPFTHDEQKKANFAEVVKKSSVGSKEQLVADVDTRNVKDMFSMWSKIFELGDRVQSNKPDKSNTEKLPQNAIKVKKKDGKILTFFKKRNKDKTQKSTYKTKRGVTAGRCEVGDGLTVKIGTASKSGGKNKYKNNIFIDEASENEEKIKKAWLQQFLARTIESTKSVKIRWNNKAYATSSSTIFEMMENVYNNTSVVFRSQSDITTEESSGYKYHNSRKHRVNFNKNVEAWMLPVLILDKNISEYDKYDDRQENDNDNLGIIISEHKWFIDRPEIFPHKIQVVLNSRNVNHLKSPSSEYLKIDIPKGFFTDTSSDNNNQDHTSNEEIYKVVEYLTPQSRSLLQTTNKIETGDHNNHNLNVTISTKNSKHLQTKIIETHVRGLSNHQEALIEGSGEYVQKCDVIGVNIITQKDENRLRKPILKIKGEHPNDIKDTSIHHIENKFAEKYIKDYYRQCGPLESGLFYGVNDSCLEYCYSKEQNKEDGCKSCTIRYDNFQTSVINSCVTSCNNGSGTCEDENTGFVALIRKKFYKEDSLKRVLPKDSHEVHRKRKMYAQSCRSKWITFNDNLQTTSSLNQVCPNTLVKCPNARNANLKPPEKEVEKTTNKYSPDRQPKNNCSVKQHNCPPPPPPSGILMFKKTSKCNESKHVEINPKVCTITPRKCSDPPPSANGCVKPTSSKCSSCPVPPTKMIKQCQIPSSECIPAPSCSPMIKQCQIPSSECIPAPSCSPVSKKPNICKNRSLPRKLNAQTTLPSCSICGRSRSKQSTQTSSTQSILKKQNGSINDLICPKYQKQNLSCCSKANKESLCVQGIDPKPSISDDTLSLCKSEQTLPLCDACLKILNQELSCPVKKQNSNQPSLCSICSETVMIPSKDCIPLPKITGVNLRIKGSLKKCDNECPTKKYKSRLKPKFEQCNEILTNENRASEVKSKKCSIERTDSDDIIINLKKETVSIEEIGKALNIKVKDSDGNTLYEKTEYFNDQVPNRQKLPSLFNDLYNNSEYHTFNSQESVANLTDISCKLNVVQNDKTFNVDTLNNSTLRKLKYDTRNMIVQTSHVYLMKDDAEKCMENKEEKNYINLKIIIRTVEPKNENIQEGENYTNRISQKFNTVSTGFSDRFIGQTTYKSYALEKDHIGVSSSREQYEKNSNKSTFVTSKQTKNIEDDQNHIVTSNGEILGSCQYKDNILIKEDIPTENIDKDQSEKEIQIYLSGKSINVDSPQSKDDNINIEEIPIENIEKDQSETQIDIVADLNSKEENLRSSQSKKQDISKGETINNISVINTDNQIVDPIVSYTHDTVDTLLDTNVDLITEALMKDEKRIIQKVFNKKPKTKKYKNKKKMKQFKEMLHAIFTDSSDHEEKIIPSKDFIKEMTYTSLKSSPIENTDSSTNSRKSISSVNLMLEKNANDIPQSELSYISENSKQLLSSNSSKSIIAEDGKCTCPCNTFAKRLKIGKSGGVCCCKKSRKSNKEIMCNFEDQDSLLCKRVVECVNIEMQKFENVKTKDLSESISKTLVLDRNYTESKNGKIALSRDNNCPTDQECPAYETQRILSMSNEEKTQLLKLNQTEPSVIELSKENYLKQFIETNEIKILSSYKNSSNILQSYETKKAVLQLYTQKKITKDGKCFIAKLPKFVYKLDIRELTK